MRAISLFSGGLDSTIAAKLIADQGIDVIALHVDIGFGGIGDKKAHLQKMADYAKATLKIVDDREQFIRDVLFDPKYGYGKNFNPCIDCHGNMFAIAKAMMKELDASFLVSGEVLGQRPMSQRKDALQSVQNLSETKDILLRPISAKLLEPTLPEREGWVDREKLLGISGRGRTQQLELAKKWGFEDFESPAGGCLLTDVGFSNRLKEFIKYDKLTPADIETLKYGRQLRLPEGAKLVVGRHKEDNEALEKIENDKYEKMRLSIAGPLSLLEKKASRSDRALAATIAATYGKPTEDEVEVKIGEERIRVRQMDSKEPIRAYMIQ